MNSLQLGSISIRDTGGNLVLKNVNNPKNVPINLWMAGDHSSMMTTRANGTQNWFGY